MLKFLDESFGALFIGCAIGVALGFLSGGLALFDQASPWALSAIGGSLCLSLIIGFRYKTLITLRFAGIVGAAVLGFLTMANILLSAVDVGKGPPLMTVTPTLIASVVLAYSVCVLLLTVVEAIGKQASS